MLSSSIWITGPSRSGKTTRLIELLDRWGQQLKHPLERDRSQPTILVLAANSDNRMKLLDRISEKIRDQSFFNSTTPLGFFEEEVTLFWPLLIRSLDLRAQFPLRLRPEMEQELARRLWSPKIERGLLRQPGANVDRIVRRFLDLFQLAAFSATPTEEIGNILEEGLDLDNSLDWSSVVLALQDWRHWCLERGLLTYGIISELYWRYLLPDTSYQQHLIRRYPLVLADDVDEYPAIAARLFDFLLDQGATIGFTYNPDGGIRLGLGADPDYLARLQEYCRLEALDSQSEVVAEIGRPMLELATAACGSIAPSFKLPDYVQSIERKSRSELLRETVEIITQDIKSGLVEPQEVAIIAPGLDAIARYTLISLLTYSGIPVQPLKEQRSIVSYPKIRALLTLLTLVYPGLGRLADRDAVAEMLVVLSERGNGEWSVENPKSTIQRDIDPVRGGMLADSCFYPDVENPRLLEVKAFPRWDLLGYRATDAYRRIVDWIEEQRSQQQQRQLPSPIFLLDRAIQKFFMSGVSRSYPGPSASPTTYWPSAKSFGRPDGPATSLPLNLPGPGTEELAALRELMETATHYWEVDGRLKKFDPNESPEAIAQFIGLLRRGAIGANPFPVRAIGPSKARVTLATIFQYRLSRQSHRWQFWLDAGSSLWLSGGAATLFAAPLFLRDSLELRETAEGVEREAPGREADVKRLRRILIDLLSRINDRGPALPENGQIVSGSSPNGAGGREANDRWEPTMSKQHRIYLCHSELAVSGQEQTGPLVPLVDACVSAKPSLLV